MKKKGFKAGGMKKKGYAMGKMVGMKKKGFAAGKAVKPDFPDVDGDGDRTEPISQAQGQLQGKKGDEPVKKAQGKMVNMKKKGYAKGKMVKKGAANGGKKNGKAKVRGAGIARKGVRPAKMR
tara:strand:+ start:341 stop:706 length:366 start_codon:yes stop_codon:yes gene_type:complete